MKRIPLLLSIALLMVGLGACTSNGPVPAATNPPITPTEILSTVSPTTTAAPAASPTTADIILATATPTSRPTDSPTATATQPKPSPTALVLRNIPIEGGDPNNKFFALLVYPNDPVFTTRLWFRVYAHKPENSKVDGQGIEKVDFTITNSDGVVVHQRTERTAGYCAFSGGEPDCLVWVFAEHQYKWPDGGKILSGTYKLNVAATSNEQTVMFGETTFIIKVP